MTEERPIQLFVCEMCRTAGKEDFKTPTDEIGAAIMEEHLREVHKVER